jgi:hypothetical protein
LTDQFTPQAPFQAVRPARSLGQVIGGSVVALAGLLNAPELFLTVQEVTSSGDLQWWQIAFLLISLLGGVGVTLAGALGAFMNKKLALAAGAGWFVARLVGPALVYLIYIALDDFDFSYFQWDTLTRTWDWQGTLSFISAFVALAGAVLAWRLNSSAQPEASQQWTAPSPDTYAPPATSAQASASQITGTAPGWYFDPSVGGQRYWDGSTWLNIPAPGGAAPQGQTGQAAPAPGIAVAAFVLSLVMPLVGLIMGYVARNQARLSPNPQAGASLIKAAIIIGWIFTILGVIGSIIYGIAMAMLLNQNYYY